MYKSKPKTKSFKVFLTILVLCFSTIFITPSFVAADGSGSNPPPPHAPENSYNYTVEDVIWLISVI